MHYQLSRDENGHESIVVIGSFGARTIDGTNPNFGAIVAGVTSDSMSEEQFLRHAEPGIGISQKFAEVTDRVRYVNGEVLFDGDVVDNSLTRHMLAKLHNGDEDWRNLVAFMVNLSQNPNPKARANLYEWVERHGVVITPDGMMVGYKGVKSDGTSVHSGYGIVDGQVFENSTLPHNIGSVVEFPRSKVDESSTACSVGLHVGTYDYASRFAQRLLTVHVNPRDVVGGGAIGDLSWKYRTCRYVVVDLAPESAYEGTSWSPDEDEDEDDRCDECDELMDECECCEDCGRTYCNGPCEGCGYCECEGDCGDEDDWDSDEDDEPSGPTFENPIFAPVEEPVFDTFIDREDSELLPDWDEDEPEATTYRIVSNGYVTVAVWVEAAGQWQLSHRTADEFKAWLRTVDSYQSLS